MILLTGATGFLGRAAMSHLDNIQGIARSASGNSPHNLITADLARADSVNAVLDGIGGEHVDTIIHMAATTPWAGGVNIQYDLDMARSVCDIARAVIPRQVIYLSGWVVCSDDTIAPIAEKCSLLPSTDYGKSKLAVEQYFHEHLRGVPCAILRMSSIYGPGQMSFGLIPNVVGAALRDGAITINDNGVRRDYLYVDDFLHALRTLVDCPLSKSAVINIGSGLSVSSREVANLVVKVFMDQGVVIKLHVQSVEAASILVDSRLDISHAMHVGLLKDITPIEVGIGKYIAWRTKHEAIQ